MSSIGRRRLTAFLIVIGTVAFLGVIHWLSEPAPSSADPADPDYPEVSIVFVIDSSQSMFPALGPTYFDLAKEGIAEFLRLPGFPKDDGTYEISVTQYAELDAPGYLEGTPEDPDGAQWFGPVHLTNEQYADGETRWDRVVSMVENLKRCTHFSASLMELGIREATALLTTESAGDGQTERHIILVTTGEYRLPQPCPPACYTRPADCPGDSWTCDDTLGCYPLGEYCNRACHIRHFINQAREANIRLSILRVGPDWKNDYYYCPEEPRPYWDWMTESTVHCPASTADLPSQPDRGGFMIELATCCPDGSGNSASCDDAIAGKTSRINPFYCFGTGIENCQPGTPKAIAETIAGWFCEWHPGDESSDDDGVPRLCDNCPLTANPNQRDCNRNGIGDVCEWSLQSCGPDTFDLDCDGVPNGDLDLDGDGFPDGTDRCEGGDDCLVAMWTADLECDDLDDPNECGCDCDHDGYSDPCQAAIEIESLPDVHTLPYPPLDWAMIDHNLNGIADYCDGAGTGCNAVPSVCDIQNMPVYTETFAEYTEGDAMDWLHGRGWWITPDDQSSMVQIAPDPDDRNHLDLYASAGNSWLIEGPGLRLPRPECLGSSCDTPNVSRWGVYAIELELRACIKRVLHV